MTTLELLRKIHDAIGNTWPSTDMVPVKLAVLLPELRVEIRRQELDQKELIHEDFDVNDTETSWANPDPE